ncbi:MAG: Thiol-disulfide isomerase-like thioredoxin [Frankiales bacterium]|nr:Thiol-disulfide isomerase-like thioredoxin [Frankiales bacterium]
MTRARWVALFAVAAAVVAAFVLGSGGTHKPSAKPVDLAPLRAAAALTPCPTGVSPALPALTLSCLGGGSPVSLRGAPSGPTLVNVYGSWCGPCLEEMPLLASFSKGAAGKVSLLGIDTEDDPRMALRFAKDVGQTWNALVDDDGVVMRKYAPGPPITLFVDAAGTVVHVKVGALKDVAELRSLTARYLKVSV